MQIIIDFGKGRVLWNYEKAGIEMQTNWLEPGPSNTKDMCLIPVWAIPLRDGLGDP